MRIFDFLMRRLIQYILPNVRISHVADVDNFCHACWQLFSDSIGMCNVLYQKYLRFGGIHVVVLLYISLITALSMFMIIVLTRLPS